MEQDLSEIGRWLSQFDWQDVKRVSSFVVGILFFSIFDIGERGSEFGLTIVAVLAGVATYYVVPLFPFLIGLWVLFLTTSPLWCDLSANRNGS